eukprot:1157291_1
MSASTSLFAWFIIGISYCDVNIRDNGETWMCNKNPSQHVISPLNRGDRVLVGKLKQVQVMHRHGARFNSHPITDYLPNASDTSSDRDCNVSSVTTQAMTQVTICNKFNNSTTQYVFRKAYVQDEEILQGTDCTHDQSASDLTPQFQANAEILKKAYVGEQKWHLFDESVLNDITFNFKNYSRDGRVELRSTNWERTVASVVTLASSFFVPIVTPECESTVTYSCCGNTKGFMWQSNNYKCAGNDSDWNSVDDTSQYDQQLCDVSFFNASMAGYNGTVIDGRNVLFDTDDISPYTHAVGEFCQCKFTLSECDEDAQDSAPTATIFKLEIPYDGPFDSFTCYPSSCTEQKEYIEWVKLIEEDEGYHNTAQDEIYSSTFGQDTINAFESEGGVWKKNNTGKELQYPYCRGASLPLSNQTFRDAVRLSYEWQSAELDTTYFEDQEQCIYKFVATPVLYKILEGINAIDLNSDDYPKLIVLSAHDCTSKILLKALGMWNKEQVIFAEMLSLEIYTRADGLDSGFWFRWTKKGKFIPFPRCNYDSGTELCDLHFLKNNDGFQDLVDQETWNNEKCPNVVTMCECGYCTTNTTTTEQADNADTTPVFIMILCTSFLSLLAY